MAGRLRFQLLMAFMGIFAHLAIADENQVKTVSPASVDRVIITTGDVNRRYLHHYHYAVLKLALEHSEPEFGPFRLEHHDADINNARVLREMETTSREGRINVHITPSSPLRQARFLTVHIPVRMGLLGYRLMVVHKKNLPKFSKIDSLEELRQYRIGSGASWTTTTILKQLDFDVVTFPRFKPMYSMLARNRFDLVLRGVNEIYQELETCGTDCDELAIVPGVQVYLPMPYYIFVSKYHPRIAERIEKGLLSATNDGSFKALFTRYYGDYLARAKVADRRIINIPNHDLSNDPALKKAAFWITPCDIRDKSTDLPCANFDDVMPRQNSSNQITVE